MTMLPPDPLYIFKGEMQPLSCITFRITVTKVYVYAGSLKGIVHTWDLKSKREVNQFKIGDDTCLSILTYEEDLIITHDKIGKISLWKEESKSWTLLNQIKTDFFGFCKFYVHQNILYTSLKNSKCQMISIKTFEPIGVLNFINDNKLGDIMAFKVFVFLCKTVILVAYEGHKLMLWDVNEFKKVNELKLDECPMAIDFDVVANKGIVGNPSEKICIFSLDKNAQFNLEKTIILVNPGVASVRIRPDNKLVAVGCWDGKLRLYSWKTFVLLAVLDTHSSTIQDICFSKGYKDKEAGKFLLAAASQDCRISLWDLYN